jgi:hypothetical protein
MVWYPAACNLAMSVAAMPCSCNNSKDWYETATWYNCIYKLYELCKNCEVRITDHTDELNCIRAKDWMKTKAHTSIWSSSLVCMVVVWTSSGLCIAISVAIFLVQNRIRQVRKRVKWTMISQCWFVIKWSTIEWSTGEATSTTKQADGVRWTNKWHSDCRYDTSCEKNWAQRCAWRRIPHAVMRSCGREEFVCTPYVSGLHKDTDGQK